MNGRASRPVLLLLAFSLVVALLPTPVAAAQAAPGLVISEVYYNPPGVTEGHEFVELHNTTANPIAVGGYTFLTGIAFTFPAGSSIAPNGRVVLAANAAEFEAVFGFAPSGVFTGTLSNSGESLMVVSTTNTVVDQVIYSDAAPWPISADGGGDSLVRVATGLAPDNAAAWAAGPPTPQLANSPTLGVIFSVPRGWYGSNQVVTLTPSVPGATIVFNTNGSGTATTAYTGPITITNNGGIRVIQAQARLGGQTSPLITHTYVFRADTGSPVVATWPNGLPVAPGEDEVTASFEFIPPPSTGLTPSAGNAGIAASAGGIDAGDSDKVFFRGVYGNGTLTADLFGDNFYGLVPTRRHDQLFFRAEHLDGTHLRQIIAHDALLALGKLSPHGRFVQYYRNGTAAGVRHLQERPEGGFMESYTGIGKDQWLAWSTHELTPGTGTPNGLGAETMGSPFTSFADATESVNVEDLVDYLLVQWQANVSDYRSIKNFRTAGPIDFTTAVHTPGAPNSVGDFRYHFFNWDMDIGYANNLYGRGGPTGWGWAGFVSPDWIAHDLDQFIEFRNLASDRIVCAHFDDGPLTSAGFVSRLADRRQELVAAGGVDEQAFVTSLLSWLDSRNTWLLTAYRGPGADRTVYGTQRPDTAPWKPPSDFTGPLLQADAPVVVTVTDAVMTITNPNGGQVWYRTDGGDPRNLDGTLHPAAKQYTAPVPLLAGRTEVLARSFDAAGADVFQRWSPACNIPKAFDLDHAGGSTGIGLAINELHYNPLGANGVNGDLLEFVELYNPTVRQMNVTGFRFSEGIDFTFPPETVIEPREYLVGASNREAFLAEYGFEPDFTYGDGASGDRLNDGGERVALVDALGRHIDAVTYADFAPWPTTPDGQGPSLSLRDPGLNHAQAESWFASYSTSGTPGMSNSIGSRGDVDCSGRVDVIDALLIAQFTVETRTENQRCIGRNPPTDVLADSGDFDDSGAVNIVDALLIAQCSVGIDNGLCTE